MEINYHAFRKNHCQLPGIYSSDAVCSAALWTPADIKDSPCEKPFQLLRLLISNLLTLKMIWWNKHCLNLHLNMTNHVMFKERGTSGLDSGDFCYKTHQQQYFHHILHLSKLPYQQHDLKAVQETTICAFWRTIKRCQTWFPLHCFGSGCQRIKHYLKEDSFSREKGLARFTGGDEGAP